MRLIHANTAAYMIYY